MGHKNSKGNVSLTNYKGESKNPLQADKTIVGYFEEWTSDIKQMDCVKHTNYNSVRNMLKKWGKIDQGNILKKLNA
jgi:hypothetical protein